MKISKQLQKKYCELARESQFENMHKVYQENKEQFDVVYCIYHGLLNLESVVKLIDSVYCHKTKDLTSYWNIKRRGQQDSLICWLMNKMGTSSCRVIQRLILVGFTLDEIDYREFLFGKSAKSYLRILDQMRMTTAEIELLNQVLGEEVPRSVLEREGWDYFTWLLEKGSIRQLEENYREGILIQQQNTVPFINLVKGESRISWMMEKMIKEGITVKGLDLDLCKKKFIYKERLDFNIFEKDFILELGVKEPKTREAIINFLNKAEVFSYGIINALVSINQLQPRVRIDGQFAKIINQLTKINIESETDRKELWDFLCEQTPYSEYRKKKLLLIGSRKYIFEDLKKMLISRAPSAKALGVKLLPAKPQSLSEIHNWVIRIPENIEVNRQIVQKIQKDLPEYQDQGLSIYYPCDDLTFVKEGVFLNICVGDSSYRDSVADQHKNVVIIKDDNQKSIACAEIDNQGTIIQLVGYENATVSSRVANFVDNFIQAWLSKINN